MSEISCLCVTHTIYRRMHHTHCMPQRRCGQMKAFTAPAISNAVWPLLTPAPIPRMHISPRMLPAHARQQTKHYVFSPETPPRQQAGAVIYPAACLAPGGVCVPSAPGCTDQAQSPHAAAQQAVQQVSSLFHLPPHPTPQPHRSSCPLQLKHTARAVALSAETHQPPLLLLLLQKATTETDATASSIIGCYCCCCCHNAASCCCSCCTSAAMVCKACGSSVSFLVSGSRTLRAFSTSLRALSKA